MTYGQVAGFFLDSCILLPHSLESTYESCSIFLKKAEKDCLISSSIKKEALDLSGEAYSVICANLRSNLKPLLEKNGIKLITNRDGKTLAKIFSEQKRQIGLLLPTRSNVRNELIGAIENYVANRVHALKDGVSIPVDDLLASALTELEKARYSIEKPFKTIKTVDIKPDDMITSMVLLKTLIINEKDIEHLASAITFQFQQNKWVIFVTNDEKEILSKEKELWEIFTLQCSKPSWALDNYQDMTKFKSPVEYYQELDHYSEKQIEFGVLAEKAMGVKIIKQ